VRRKRVLDGDMALDEQPSQNPIQNFKINITINNNIITIINIINTQISERFNETSIPLIKDLALFQKKKTISRNNQICKYSC